MNKNELLENAIGKIDDDLLLDAETVRNQKPRRRFAFFLAAACLTLMLLAIPIGILIGNRNETPEVPIITTNNTVITTVTLPTTTIPPQTTARPSVLDIPGAMLFDENDNRFNLSVGKPYSSGVIITDAQARDWAKRVKQENSVVIGLVKDSTSVLVAEGDEYYRITYMEFTVLEDVSGGHEETVTVAYACRYQLNASKYRPASGYTIGNGTNIQTDEIVENVGFTNDMFHLAKLCTEMNPKDGSAALLLLQDAKDKKLNLGNITYELSDYADYVMDACLIHNINRNHATSLSILGVRMLNFPTDMLREIIHDSIWLRRDPDGVSFSFEDSYETFDNHPALSVTVDYQSIFYNDIFIVEDNKPKLNQTNKWVITIEGVRYEIENIWHYKYHLNHETTYANPPSVALYFDLGPNFSWSLFDYDENDEYTFKDIRIDLYDENNKLICSTNLIDTSECDGYTHKKPSTPVTPPETIDPVGKGIDILRGKETPTHEPDPQLMTLLAMDNAFFRFENAYTEFNNHAALVLSLNKESVITEDLFLDLDDPQTNIGYVWEVIIEGITYEIEGISFDNTSSELLVYLDLGHNFSWSRYSYNENGEYTFEEVTLGIYLSDYHSQPTYTYDYFAKLTDDEFYGGNTHTKPN